MSPRAFERPATIALPEGAEPDPGSVLEGLFVPGTADDTPGAVIAPPHPQMGGTMATPVVTEVATAVELSGYASLRFNWRGVGGSAGVPSGETSVADVDYQAALDFVIDGAPGKVMACGYSWGALAAARVAAASPRVKRMILVAPPAAMLAADALAANGGPVLVLAGDRDDFVPLAPLREALEPIENVSLTVIPGADHFFMSGLGEISSAIREWLD